MIDDVLETIKNEIDTFIRLKMKDNRQEYVQLVPVVDLGGKPSLNENTLCMSLVRIEEDRVNMSDGVYSENVGNDVRFYNQPLRLTLYVLLSAVFSDGQQKNYKEALKRLSFAIGFFQAKQVFTAANSPRLDHRYGKIKIELYNMTIEEQNQLWSMMGGLYRPSVMYRFQTLLIREKQVTGTARSGEEMVMDIGTTL